VAGGIVDGSFEAVQPNAIIELFRRLRCRVMLDIVRDVGF
jgi:hypothetical protein